MTALCYGDIAAGQPAVEVFRSSRVAGGLRGEIDRVRGILYGAKIIEGGRLNDDRPWVVDDTTLDQVVDLARGQSSGVKARFTHPSMSEDGLGHFLGRWKGFRREDSAVYADLYLAASAKSSPRGDLWSYVLELAAEDAAAFGVSVATILSASMFEDEAEEDPKTGLTLLRFEALRAADIVDEPAATRGGLFSLREDDRRDLPDIVSRLIFQHFGKNPDPEVVRDRFEGLLTRYCAGRGRPVEKTKKTDAGTIDAKQLQDYVNRFGSDDGLKWLLEERPLEDCYADALQAEREINAANLQTLKDDHAAALDAQKESHTSALQAVTEDLSQVTRERDELLAKLAAIELGEAEELDAGDRAASERRAGGFANKIRLPSVN